MKVEVTFGLLSFISGFVLCCWTSILLIKLQIKNEHRIIHSNELERTSCFTLNSLLTRFLWIVMIVSILWLIQCVFTFRIRLWSNSIIDASNIENKNNQHDVTVIVLYFVFDLIALTLLLILYYILCEELSNLYDLQIMEQNRNQNISHSHSQSHKARPNANMSQNPVTPSEKGISFYTPSQRRERRQSRMERQKVRRRQAMRMGVGIPGRYERSDSNSHSSVIELKRERDADNGDIDLSVCSVDMDGSGLGMANLANLGLQGNMDIFEEADSGMDCDNEDETETQFLPNYPPNMMRNSNEINDSQTMTEIIDDSLPSKPL